MSYVDKITGWMPPHFRTDNYKPYLKVAGEVFNELQTQIEQMFDETFISQANSEFLPIHAKERGYSRISYGPTGDIKPETLVSWANRVRRIKYNRTSANILRNLESVAPIFNAKVVLDYPDGVLTATGDNRTDDLEADYPSASWGNYGPLDKKKRFKCFSVVIEFPIPPPLSLLDDEYFLDDNAYLDDRSRIFDERTAFAIKALVGRKAPAGAGWRLLIKGFDGVTVGTEAEQETELNSFKN